ncbi:MAG: carbon-nitrogen hydrolase family protein, partial [Terriglobia bacterium]
MTGASLTVALISDVFPGEDAEGRLLERLREAKDAGAALALLPELPLNPWSPATKTAHAEDAEPPGGPRHAIQSRAAKEIGIGLIGGAIVRDRGDRKRYNTALAFDAGGGLLARYRKAHIPEEEGFWETSHYQPGDAAPSLIDAFALRIGLQICSDANRPQGSHVLGALGAEAILVPRATERATYERWKLVFRANALTSAAYVLSVNRPWPEQGVNLGGQSIAVAPDGEVLLESTDSVSVVTLKRRAVLKARRDYPGYLPVRAELYARAWQQVARSA